MQNAASDTGKIARSAGTVSIAVMCSRVLGLVRAQVFAALFGAGFAYDAFVVAFRIPNLLRDLFGEGALSAAFVTVFSDYHENRGEAATWQLANNVLCVIAILLSLIALLGIYCSEDLVRLLAPDYGLIAGKVALTAKLTAIMFPFLVFISLSAVVMGMLNAKGRFFVPAMASSFFNLGSIFGGVALALTLPRFGQPAIAGSELISFVIAFALMIVLHEGLHGLLFWLFSHARPTFGVGWVYAYAAAPDWYFPRNQFVIIAIAPLVGITALGLLLMGSLPLVALPTLLFLLIFNGAGSAGDLYAMVTSLFYPADILVNDQGDQFTIYGDPDLMPTLPDRPNR